MKTLIAVPCLETVPSHFASSLAMLNRVGDCQVAFNVGSLVYNSRNELARLAVRTEADYILWIDSDMVFHPDALEMLMEDMKDHDFVCGLAFRRGKPYTPVLFKTLSLQGTCEQMNEYPDSIFEIAASGFGMVLMKTEILFDVAAKFQTWFAPYENLGEDLSFCWRAKECGYKFYCDPRVKLGHVGRVIVTEDFWKAYKA